MSTDEGPLPSTEREELLAKIQFLEEDLNALKIDNAQLSLRVRSEGSVLAMAVARLGGIVEGNPTGRVNFMQRIDALREIERLGGC